MPSFVLLNQNTTIIQKSSKPKMICFSSIHEGIHVKLEVVLFSVMYGLILKK